MMRDTFDRFTPPERGRFGDNETQPRRQRVNGSSNLVDVVMVHHVDRETRNAVLVSSDGDRTKAVWLPKSQCQLEEIGPPERKNRGFINQPVKIAMPSWLAREKGLM